MVLTYSLLASSMAATVAAETIHAVAMFTRHGDRTAKFYSTYHLTDLGAEQNYQSGNWYRERYLLSSSPNQVKGISQDSVTASQIYAIVPDTATLYQTSQSFLQGFYPPLGNINPTLSVEKLVNGSNSEAPLNDYQFIQIHVTPTNSPDDIWLKGQDSCPNFASFSGTYRQSAEYQSTLNSTASFYKQFEPLLNDILGAGNVTYKQAYNVFDLLNVASIHNASIANKIDSAALTQARYLANQWESGMNFNNTMPLRSIGGQTFIGALLNQMNTTVSSKAAKQKFTLFTGSYNTFLSFYGLTNLTSTDPTFLGIPNYGGNIVFEMYSDGTNDTFPTNPNNDLKVRFLQRNGTENGTALINYPLFGEGNLNVTYGTFVSKMSKLALSSVSQWCNTCGGTTLYCAGANATTQASTNNSNGSGSTSGSSSSSSNGYHTGLSLAAAGGIGAGVTLAVVAILGGLAALLMRKRHRKTAAPVTSERKGSGSESSSV